MTVIPRSLRWLFTWSKFAVPRQTLLVLLFSRKEVTQPRRLCNEPFVSRGTILILKPQSRVLAYQPIIGPLPHQQPSKRRAVMSPNNPLHYNILL